MRLSGGTRPVREAGDGFAPCLEPDSSVFDPHPALAQMLFEEQSSPILLLIQDWLDRHLALRLVRLLAVEDGDMADDPDEMALGLLCKL